MLDNLPNKNRLFFKAQTVRLIETVRLAICYNRMRSYGTFNRDFLDFTQTVHLIEWVRLIET